MRTELIIVNIEECRELLSKPEVFCSKERLRQCSKYDGERRMQGLAAELALSYALSGERLLPPKYSRFPDGRPVIEGGCISLSHTRGWAVCAFSDIPVGVDIEALRIVQGSVARRVLCQAELKAFERMGEKSSRFLLERWVMKEAFLKLKGTGLSGGMNRVFEKDASVFYDGVLGGYVNFYGDDGFIGCVVTSERTELRIRTLPAELK